MTPLQVELLVVDERVKRRAALLATAITVVGLAVTIVQGWRAWQAHEEGVRLQQRAAAGALTGLLAPGPPVPPPYHAEALKLSKAAAFDSGRVLADGEAVREPGVRLRSIHIDAFAAAATAEFDIQDLAAMTAVMESLNPIGTTRAWEMVSVEGPRNGLAGSLKVKGQWKVELEKIVAEGEAGEQRQVPRNRR